MDWLPFDEDDGGLSANLTVQWPSSSTLRDPFSSGVIIWTFAVDNESRDGFVAAAVSSLVGVGNPTSRVATVGRQGASSTKIWEPCGAFWFEGSNKTFFLLVSRVRLSCLSARAAYLASRSSHAEFSSVADPSWPTGC